MRAPARTLIAVLCALIAASCGGEAGEPPEVPIQTDVLSMAPRRGNSEIARFLGSAEARGFRIARATVHLKDIPRAEVPPIPDARAAPADAKAVNEWRATGLAFVEARELAPACPSHGAVRHALCAACMNPKNPRGVRAEGPVPGSAKNRSLRYEIIDGVRDPVSAAGIVETKRTRVVAKEVIPHLLYAFRFSDDTQPGIDLISFILPPAINLEVSRSGFVDPAIDVRNAFSRITLPVRPGGSEAIVASVTSDAAAAWVERLSPGAPLPPDHGFLIGVELSQAGLEAEPRIVAYLSGIQGVETPE